MGDVAWFKAVWSSGPTYVNDRAVLLVLVDCMSHDGFRAWPSVATIASRVGISDRRVRDRLRALEADGWITAESLGGGRHRTTTYVVNVGRFGTPGNPDETRTVRPGKKPGRNPDVVTQNPDVASLNPDVASAERLERLGTGGAARAGVEAPLPGVIHPAPSPCPRHPNGWHHDDPCRRCKSLREYDEQQRAAAPRWQSCGECSNGWVEDPATGRPVEKCTCHPTFDGPRPDHPRNGKRHEETAPTTSEVLAESADERDARHRELMAPTLARQRAIASLSKRFG